MSSPSSVGSSIASIIRSSLSKPVGDGLDDVGEGSGEHDARAPPVVPCSDHPEAKSVPHVVLSYPSGSISVAFSSEHLPPNADGRTLPSCLLNPDRDVLLDDDDDDDEEAFSAGGLSWISDAQLELQLSRTKKLFTGFLVLDILYCLLLIAGSIYFRSGENFMLFPVVLMLAINVVVNIITILGLGGDITWPLTIFVLVEGMTVAFLLFYSFSPLLVLRLVVLMMGVQIRQRMILLRNRRRRRSATP